MHVTCPGTSRVVPTVEWIIGWLKDLWPGVVLWIDPWDPIARGEAEVSAIARV